MTRPNALLCALLALSLSACVARESHNATTPAVDPNSSAMDAGAAGQRLGAASWRVYDPTNGESLTLKTTAVDGGALLNVAIDSIPDGGIQVTPSGTSNVQGLGAAGSPDGGVLTAQGAPGMTPLSSSPAYVASTTYWTNQTSASTATGSAVNKSGYKGACFSFTLANTSTPVGTFHIGQSPDGSNNWGAIYLEPGKPTYCIGACSTLSNIQTFSGGYSIAINSPSGTVTINACVESTMPYVRAVYTATSGGAVSTINASYTLF